MATYLLTTSSITLANKACDILKSNGYACAVERTPKNLASGCGYSVRLKGNIEYAVSLLERNGITPKDIISQGEDGG